MTFKSTILILTFFCSITLNAAKYKINNTIGLNELLISVKLGDTIIWENGNYADQKINFNPKNNGTKQRQIILMAENAGKVIFTGNSQLIINGAWLKVTGFLFTGPSTLEKGDVLTFEAKANYCSIENCAVVNYSPKDALINNNWVNMQGQFNSVVHCYFKGKTNQGPYLVVRYYKAPDYIAGSNTAPSTYHQINYNYFGYRTMPTDNGGEDLRIGDSNTSFTAGFNIIEHNLFEDHRLEPEVISNKSCNNIYRYNTFLNNDGQMVLRHGEKCFVYGNYFDGNTGRKTSGGIRIINANQTVFNNYITNVEASEKETLKGAIVIMSGLEKSALNGYYPADSALIVYNIIKNSNTPIFKIGVGNKSKGLALVLPKNIILTQNLCINNYSNKNIAIENGPLTYAQCKENFFTNGNNILKGFLQVKKKTNLNNLFSAKLATNKKIIALINNRLTIHKIKLIDEDITIYNPKWKLNKNDVGVSFNILEN